MTAIAAIATTLAWKADAQHVSRQTTNVVVGLTNNPVRQFGNQLMDFSPAIRWYQSNPDFARPAGVALDSSLTQELERRKKAHQMEGQKWSRYLLSQGVVGGRLPEGAIITGIKVTRTIHDGYVRDGYGRNTAPKYKTIETTKEVLLKNPPEKFALPIFAFPIGQTRVGTALMEAFDYGAPLDLANRTAPLRSGSTNASQPGVARSGMRDGVPLAVYNQIAADAERDWPGNYEMQEFRIKNQIEAYKKLHP